MSSFFTLFHFTRGSKKSPETTSTTATPRTTALDDSYTESGDDDVFYILEPDGRFRPASPMTRKSSTDLDIVDAAEVMDNGAFVYIDNDSTALVFDGMEVRELHFAELPSPRDSDSISSTSTTAVPDSHTPTKEDRLTMDLTALDSTPSPDVSVDTDQSTESTTPVASETTTISSSTLSPSQDQVRPEVIEFLSRIRYSGFGTGSGAHVGKYGRLPLGSMALLYPSLVARGVIPAAIGQQFPNAWMPSMGTTRGTTNQQFDDSYYTRTAGNDDIDDDLEPLPAPQSSPASLPTPREPHMFFLRRQQSDSTTTKPPSSLTLRPTLCIANCIKYFIE